jgi:hypothetical protein
MQGAEYMTRRAEYRKSSEETLFKKVIEWAKQDEQPLIVEIVERAFADDDAENWLTLHPTSSFTGLTNHYFQVVIEEKEILGSTARLLKKQFDAYCKKLIGK